MSTLTRRYTHTRRDSRALRDLKRRGPPLNPHVEAGQNAADALVVALAIAVILAIRGGWLD